MKKDKIYHSYILKARRRRFIQYSLCFLVIALMAVPLVMNMSYGLWNGQSEEATVVSMTQDHFTVRYYTGSPDNEYRTFEKSELLLPVKVGDRLIVHSDVPLREAEEVTIDKYMPVVRIIMLIPAVYYFLKALYFMYLRKKNNENVALLHKEGELLSCDIERVENRSKIFKNYKIILTYQDDNGKTHTFETERLYFNPEVYLDGIEKVSVYVDKEDFSRYDISFPASFPSDTWHYYY